MCDQTSVQTAVTSDLTFFFFSLSLTTEAARGRGDGRSSGKAQLVEFSHFGSGQPLLEHSRRQPDDPQATPESAGEGEGPNARCGAAHRGGQ